MLHGLLILTLCALCFTAGYIRGYWSGSINERTEWAQKLYELRRQWAAEREEYFRRPQPGTIIKLDSDLGSHDPWTRLRRVPRWPGHPIDTPATDTTPPPRSTHQA